MLAFFLVYEGRHFLEKGACGVHRLQTITPLTLSNITTLLRARLVSALRVPAARMLEAQSLYKTPFSLGRFFPNVLVDAIYFQPSVFPWHSRLWKRT